MAAKHSSNGATPPPTEPTMAQKIDIMREQGWEQILPGTDRALRLRTVEPAILLRAGKCPDILTPLMLRAIYEDLTDKDLRDWLEQPLTGVEDAIQYADMLDAIAAAGIADETKVESLTASEKKWVFRFVLGSAEMLVFFRYQRPPAAVEPVAQGEPSVEAA